jgi:hypothetical protein
LFEWIENILKFGFRASRWKKLRLIILFSIFLTPSHIEASF